MTTLGGWGARPRVVVFAVALLLVGCSGCALRYANPATGAEHLWGFGQLRMCVESQNPNANWAVVTTGCRVPGLCVSVGRDHFGLNLGYFNRQQLSVVSNDEIAMLQPPTNSLAGLWAREANSRWVFGWLRMQSVGASHRRLAVVTGRALAGLRMGAGSGDTSIGMFLDSRQMLRIHDEDVHLKFDQTARRWPGFDLFETRVVARRVTIDD